MKRKLVVVLLTGVICLIGVTSALAIETEAKGFMALPIEGQAEYNLPDYEKLTGKKIEKFNEAPMLRTMVAAGELPPVEDRLPKDVLVRIPLQEIGLYGGTINLPITNLNNPYPGNQLITEMLFVSDIRGPGNVAPGVAKGYDMSEDGKTFTLYLREGMKWSDGYPFTSDDFLFWWEDVMLNKELTPAIPSIWQPQGKQMRMEKVDDYTIRFHFDVPLYNVRYYFAQNDHMGAQQDLSFMPKHALTKYHIKYNKDAGKLAKEEGFEEWWQLFLDRSDTAYGTQVYKEIPVVTQYILETEFENGRTYKRNPYYHGVDPAGNQLPYIDRVRTISYTDNLETLKLRTITGEYDYVSLGLNTNDLPLLVASAEKGGYEAYLCKGAWNNHNPLLINQNLQEPVLGDLLRNKEFRQALSLAIDRQEIVDVVTLGMATPTQTTVHPTNSLYEERYATSYADYDPEKANKMLDELGLNNRDSDGFRLMPNGKTLSLLMEPTTTFPGGVETAELVKEYWENLGVKIAIKTGTYGTVFGEGGSVQNGTFHVTIILNDMGVETLWRTPGFWNGPRDTMRINWSAPLWDLWWQEDGEQGLEPPEQVKRILYLAENMYSFPEQEWREAGKEILDWWAENFFTIGIYGYQQNPVVSKLDLGNVDKNTVQGAPSDFGKGYIARLWQLYWKK